MEFQESNTPDKKKNVEDNRRPEQQQQNPRSQNIASSEGEASENLADNRAQNHQDTEMLLEADHKRLETPNNAGIEEFVHEGSTPSLNNQAQNVASFTRNPSVFSFSEFPKDNQASLQQNQQDSGSLSSNINELDLNLLYEDLNRLEETFQNPQAGPLETQYVTSNLRFPKIKSIFARLEPFLLKGFQLQSKTESLEKRLKVLEHKSSANEDALKMKTMQLNVYMQENEAAQQRIQSLESNNYDMRLSFDTKLRGIEEKIESEQSNVAGNLLQDCQNKMDQMKAQEAQREQQLIAEFAEKLENTLKEKTSTLVAEIDRLKASFAAKEKDNEALTAQISGLTKDVQLGKDALVAVEKSKAQLQKTINDIQAASEVLGKEKDTWISKFDKSTKTNEQLRVRFSTACKEIKKKHANLHAWVSQTVGIVSKDQKTVIADIGSIKERVSGMRLQTSKIFTFAKQQKKTINDLTANSGKLKDELKHAKKELESVQTKLKQTTTEKDAISTELRNLKADSKNLDSKIHDSERKAKELDQVIKTQSDQIAKFEASTADLKKQLQSSDKRTGELTGLNQNLENNIRELKNQNQNLNDNVIRLQTQNKNLEGTIKDIRSQADSRKTRISELEANATQFENLISELNTKVKASESEIKNLQVQIEEKISANTILVTRSEDLKASTKELKAQQKNYEKTIKDFQTQNENDTATINDLNSKIKAQEATIKDLQSQSKNQVETVKKFTDKIKGHEETIKALKHQEGEFKNTVKNLQAADHNHLEDIKKLTQQSLEYEETSKQHKNALEELKNELNQSKTESINLQQTIANLQEGNQNYLANIEDLSTQCQNYKANISALEKSNAANEKTIQKLQTQNKALEENIKDLKAQVKAGEKVTKDLQKENKNQDAAITALKSNIQALEVRIEQANELEASNQDLKKMIDDQSAHIQELTANLQEARTATKKLESTIAAVEKKNKTLEAKLVETIQNSKEIEKALKDSKSLIKTLEKDIKKLHDLNTRLQNQFEELTHREQALLKQNAGLIDSITNLNIEKSQAANAIIELEATVKSLNTKATASEKSAIKLQENSKMLQEKLHASEKHAKQLSKDIKSLQKGQEKSQAHVDKLKQEIDDLQTTVQILQTQIDILQTDNKALEKLVKDKRNDKSLEAKKVELAEAKEALKASISKLEAADKAQKASDKRISELESELEELNTTIADLGKDFGIPADNAKTDKKVSAKKANSPRTKKIGKNKGKDLIEKHQSDKISIKSKLAALRKVVQDLANEKNLNEINLQELKVKLQTSNKTHKSELEAVEKEKESLESMIRHFAENLSSITEENVNTGANVETRLTAKLPKVKEPESLAKVVKILRTASSSLAGVLSNQIKSISSLADKQENFKQLLEANSKEVRQIRQQLKKLERENQTLIKEKEELEGKEDLELIELKKRNKELFKANRAWNEYEKMFVKIVQSNSRSNESKSRR